MSEPTPQDQPQLELAPSARSWSVLTSSPQETEAWGERLAPLLEAGDVLAFRGDLGAGKTTLVRRLARALGAKESVSSPTFVLMHIYEGRLPLYHFDAYRLHDSSDLYNIGAEEYIGTEGIACLEWSERVESLLPPQTLYLELSYLSPQEPQGRRLTFSGPSARAQALIEELRHDP